MNIEQAILFLAAVGGFCALLMVSALLLYLWELVRDTVRDMMH